MPSIIRRHRRDGDVDGMLARARLRERLVQCAIQEIVHEAAFAEAHLGLCRMHVHIDRFRRNVQEKRIRRMASVEQQVGIGLAHGMRDHAIAHKPWK